MSRAAVLTLLVAAVSLLLFALAGLETWRLAVVAATFGAVVVTQRMAVVRLERPDAIGRVTSLTQTLGLVWQAAIYGSTGGLMSPLLPTLAAAVAGPFLGMVPEPQRRRYLIGVVLLLVGLAALPARIRGGPVPWPYGGVISALSILWAILVVRSLGQRMESAQARAASAIDELRGERVQEALAQARRLQSVGAKVAHELKNPLAAIKGLAQLLSRSAADDRTRERLSVVESEVARMEVILHEYLSFSRPLEDLHPAPVDPAALVADVVAVLSARAETGGVALASSGAAPTIRADRRRLKEALINLVSNAIEATPRGGRIEVLVGAGASGATLEVKDTGRGIRPEDMTRLGQSYFTTREGGTGLGFVLAKSAVEQHGGTIEVESRLGEGTTMRVELPAAPPEKEDRAHG